MNTPERRYSDCEVNVITRAEGSGEGESRQVEGYALKFNSLSRNLGWFREKIDANALDNADMNDVVALFNHDMNLVLARTISETLSLSIDDTGLKYTFDAPNNTAGNDLLESLRRRDIQHSSFAFSVEDQKWEEDEEGGEIRTILKIKKLYDVSPVTQPAYLNTDVSAAQRSFDDYKKQDKEETDEARRLRLYNQRARELQLAKLKRYSK